MPIAENINKSSRKLRVLVAPLDWGLGHATRCVPIIHALYEAGVEVLVAGEGSVAEILQKTQISPVILPLKGYRVRYSRSGKFFLPTMLLQGPKIFLATRSEKRWLKKIIPQYQIDAIISDNRFGFYHEGTPAVFITHQLCIQTGNSWLDKIAQKINYNFIEHFDECWVPDSAGENNLAGKLSHPLSSPAVPVKYLGVLSRFKKINSTKNNDLLIILSGPEPQRTIFENILLPQLKDIDDTTVLVRGLPIGGERIVSENDRLKIHDHLPAAELNELIQRSVHIVARCGYSTIMDLVSLQQKAILVPTPGQTEQEYLADHLMKRKLFFTCPQEGFSLSRSLKLAEAFDLTGHADTASLHEEIIKAWVEKLKTQLSVSR